MENLTGWLAGWLRCSIESGISYYGAFYI